MPNVIKYTPIMADLNNNNAIPPDPDREFRYERAMMVEEQILARGVHNAAILDVLRTIPRHRFVGREEILNAYSDRPLPITCGQTISQPYIVALMTNLLALQPEDLVLEIGTGSGYQTAVLAGLSRFVVTMERHEALSVRAQEILAELGIGNVHYVTGDGSTGFPEKAPYNAILVTAGCPRRPMELAAQLSDNGRLVAPVGPADTQQLLLVTRHGDEFLEKWDISCRFVPLIGQHGWPPVS